MRKSARMVPRPSLDVVVQHYCDAATSAALLMAAADKPEKVLSVTGAMFDRAEFLPLADAASRLSQVWPAGTLGTTEAASVLARGAPVVVELSGLSPAADDLLIMAVVPGVTTSCVSLTVPVRRVVEPVFSPGAPGAGGVTGVYSLGYGLVGGRLPDERLGAAASRRARQLAASVSGWFPVRDDPREPRVIGFAASRVLRLKQTDGTSAVDWIVLSEISMTDALHALDAFLWSLLIASVPLVLLLVVLSIWLSRWFLRPVHLLHRQAEQLGRGNLDALVDVRTGDELEDLARAFNEMARGLAAARAAEEKHLREIEDKVRERTAELERTHRQLIRTERLVAAGRLAGNIAHEINNPLGIIKNYLRILRETGGRDPEALKIIEEELDRAARTIRLLLELHQPQPAKSQRLDLNGQIESLVTLFDGPFSRRRISICTDLAPSLPEVLMPPDHFRQILINLLKNAEDAMSDGGGQIIISTKADAGRVVIVIRDSGAGIAPEHLPHIFEPFYTTKREGQGTGLGLPVTLSLVSNAGGTIELDSTVGCGTTVTLTFPAVSDNDSS
jgi:signal transduction histidine kinase